MPRRREVPKREVLPDPKFGNQDLSKFVNVLMTGKDAIEIFNLALTNAKPQVEVKSRRVGGANYQVPVEVRPSRRMALSMRWLREAARKRGEKSMGMRLAGELIDASEGRGGAVKKREEVHRMAEANKAFSHFRF
jgi:small subunit ribosomal protein S7